MLYDIRLVNNFIFAMYGVTNISLLMPNLVAFYATLNKIYIKIEFLLRWKFLSIYFRPRSTGIKFILK